MSCFSMPSAEPPQGQFPAELAVQSYHLADIEDPSAPTRYRWRPRRFTYVNDHHDCHLEYQTPLHVLRHTDLLNRIGSFNDHRIQCRVWVPVSPTLAQWGQ